MPQTYKVLGQTSPTSAATLTTLYTVPASTSAVISTLTITNLASTSTTYRVAVRPAGASIANAQYVGGYDTTIGGNDAIPLTFGMTLGATDVVSVYAGSTNVAFTAFGVEIT